MSMKILKSAQADFSFGRVWGGRWALVGALGLAQGRGDGPLRLLPFLLQVKKGSALRRKRTAESIGAQGEPHK